MDCTYCPLATFDGARQFCCNGEWKKMNNAETWADWLVGAQKVMEFIVDHGVGDEEEQQMGASGPL